MQNFVSDFKNTNTPFSPVFKILIRNGGGEGGGGGGLCLYWRTTVHRKLYSYTIWYTQRTVRNVRQYEFHTWREGKRHVTWGNMHIHDKMIHK